MFKFNNGLGIESQSGDELRQHIVQTERILAKMKNELNNRAGDGNEKMYGFYYAGNLVMWPTYAEAVNYVTQHTGNPDNAYLVKTVYRLK